jgi:thiamine biosynthesis lipoprotein
MGVLLGCSLLLFPSVRATACLSDGRYIMGTVLEITLCDHSDDVSQRRAQNDLNASFAVADRMDTLFSLFSHESIVGQLNLHAGQEALLAPPEVIDLLTLSRRYWRLSRGAFDVTVGPLLALWKTAGTTQTLPSPTSLQKARTKVGSDKIRLLPGNRAALARSGMALDFGGIGKGYALDHIAQLLKTQGYKNALLDFGQSSMWAMGAPPDAPGWRLLIQRPDGQYVGDIVLRNQALSLSASFGQQFVIQGRRYGHIIDPRNGMPLQRDRLACVIAPNATLAEALSKALLILGEHQGIALLESLPSVAGILVEAHGKQWMTHGWTKAVEFTPARTRISAPSWFWRNQPFDDIPLDNETVTSKEEP